MRARFSFLAILIFSANLLFAQTFSKTDLVFDLNFLEKAIDAGHPTTLNPAWENKISEVRDSIQRLPKETYTYIEYDNALRKALAKVGCFHTSITPAKLPVRPIRPALFPYKLWTDGTQLFAISKTRETDSIPNLEFPARIESINQIPTADLLPHLLHFKASDGPHNPFGRYLFNKYSTLLVRQYFEQDSLFVIKTKTGDFKAKAVSQTDYLGFKRKQDQLEQPGIYQTEQIGLYQLKDFPNTMYLQINSFKYKSGKGLHKTLFEKINARETTNLILDLRDNTGGTGRNGTDLIRYLINTPIAGSDIVPKSRRGAHLGVSPARAGLFTWEVLHVFYRKKNSKGRAYLSKHKPASKNFFSGNCYVLVNEATGSTSTIAAAYLKHYSNAVFYGCETGGGETGSNAGSYAKLKLPQSGIKVRYPLVRSSHDLDIPANHHGVYPDQSIEYHAEAILQQKDLELEAVLQHILTSTN